MVQKVQKTCDYNGIDSEIKEYLRHMAEEYGFVITVIEVMQGHIHMLPDCKTSVSSVRYDKNTERQYGKMAFYGAYRTEKAATGWSFVEPVILY